MRIFTFDLFPALAVHPSPQDGSHPFALLPQGDRVQFSMRLFNNLIQGQDLSGLVFHQLGDRLRLRQTCKRRQQGQYRIPLGFSWSPPSMVTGFGATLALSLDAAVGLGC